MAFRKPSTPIVDQSPNIELERLNAGSLGTFFGIAQNAPCNIAGLAVVAGLLIGGITTGVLVYQNNQTPYEIWKYVAPIVTGALGFLFGANNK